MNICFTGMHFNKALKYSIALKSVNILMLFFINLLFVRVTGANVSGNFFYLITILSFITLVVSCSMESGITYYASRDKSNTLSYAWLIILTSIVQIALSYIIITVTVKNSTSLPLPYLLLFVISNILISNFAGLYASLKWFISINTIILTINCIALIFLWLVLQQSPGTAKAENIYILSYVLQAIGLIFFFLVKNTSGSWKLPSFQVAKQVFTYSLLAFIGNICFFLVTRIDYVFVKRFCSAEALGNYVQVGKIVHMFVLLPAIAASVIFPYTANSNETILPKVQWLCRLTTSVIALASVFLIVTGKWLFPWLFGAEFNLMYIVILIYIPGIFALCISSLLASYISGSGYILVNVTASAIALIIVIIGDLIFIPEYGINAAAVVSSVAYLCCMLYLIRHYIIKFQSKVSDFFRISFTEFKYVFFYIKNKNKTGL